MRSFSSEFFTRNMTLMAYSRRDREAYKTILAGSYQDSSQEEKVLYFKAATSLFVIWWAISFLISLIAMILTLVFYAPLGFLFITYYAPPFILFCIMEGLHRKQLKAEKGENVFFGRKDLFYCIVIGLSMAALVSSFSEITRLEYEQNIKNS